MAKKAFITGITGQDGSYLTELLLFKGYEVHGLVRRNSGYDLNNVRHLESQIHIHYGDVLGDYDLANLIDGLKPDEFYNLAAQSDVRLSFDTRQYTIDVDGKAVERMIDNVIHCSPKTRFYQASTSELFGNSPAPQSETTPHMPSSPYAAGKEIAYKAVRDARERSLFACNGILFNHESERRGLNFVTRKVTRAVAGIVYNEHKELKMGNLDAVRDWGYAGDYVEAMWLMLQHNKPNDYVIGTGECHSVRDLLEVAFGYMNLDWRDYVTIDDTFKRPTEVNYLQADPRKAHSVLGWKAKTTFKQLIEKMLQHDLAEVSKIAKV